MPANLKKLQEPIREELKHFDKTFRASMKTDVFLLDKIMSYIVKRKGKQMRPMFVLLSAKANSDQVGQSAFRGAALIELLHTATLVHDDVVDNSDKRRGFFSINALWKNKIAVLVGDFLLSKGLLLSIDNNDFQLLKIVSNAVKEMSEGELLQMEKARLLNITEEVYFQIIRQKTATLIAACCAVGASSVGADDLTIKRFHDFGEKVGIAFQIKDDLFDYQESAAIGKPVGIDIKEKKMTLPLIYALNKTDKKTKKHIVNLIKNHSQKNDKVKEVINFVKQSGGIDYAMDKMNQYYQEAKNLMTPVSSSQAKDALLGLVDYTIERNV